jgi:hypothetical protein
VCKVDVSDADHRFADAVDGETTLASAEAGPMHLLWVESGTGDGKWAVGRFEGGGTPLAKLGTLASEWEPGDATVSITPDGGTSPDDDLDVIIEMPGTEPPLSFGNEEGDQLAYAEVGEVRFLLSFRRFRASAAQYEYLGNGGDAGAPDFYPMPIKAV